MAPVALPDSCLRDWLHAASVDGKVLDKTMIKLEEEDVFEVGDLVELRSASGPSQGASRLAVQGRSKKSSF